MSPIELIVRFAVVAAIFAVSMVLLRRYVARQARATGAIADGFKVLSRLTLGKGNELVLVESAGRTYVVGVGNTHVLEVAHAQMGFSPLRSAPSEAVPEGDTTSSEAATAEVSRVTADPAADPIPAQPLLLSWSQAFARWLGFATRPARRGNFSAALDAAMAFDQDRAPRGADAGADEVATAARGLADEVVPQGSVPAVSATTDKPARQKAPKSSARRSSVEAKSGTSRATSSSRAKKTPNPNSMSAPASKTPAGRPAAAAPSVPAPSERANRAQPSRASLGKSAARGSAPATPPSSEEVGAFYRTLLIEPRDIAKDRP